MAASVRRRSARRGGASSSSSLGSGSVQDLSCSVLKDHENIKAPHSRVRNKGSFFPFLVILLLAAMMRIFMASFPYSGQATPPRFGDFEAQRNWMAITLSVPIRLWYKFDLEYWGLDYPPLTAFHSYVCGLYVRLFEPDAMVSPITSRGIETEALKTAMRTTVLFSDLAIFMPAAYALASSASASPSRC